MSILEWIITLGIPSGIFSIIGTVFMHKIKKREKEREEKEKLREERQEKFTLLLIQSVHQANVVARATAVAVQRIPDAKCNGDMEKALKTADDLQMKEKDMLIELGLGVIYGHED